MSGAEADELLRNLQVLEFSDEEIMAYIQQINRVRDEEWRRHCPEQARAFDRMMVEKTDRYNYEQRFQAYLRWARGPYFWRLLLAHVMVKA